MSPIPESTTQLESSPGELTSKFKEILKQNGITDPVSEVTMEDSGLRGENMASQTRCVTVKFENPNCKPLNLFVKMQTTNPSHIAMIQESKLFEKEAQFFMKYVPAAREFCKSKGQEKLMNIYPKCYYGDENMMVFENLVLDKGFSLLKKEEQQDFEAASFALTSLAKHHGISYAFIKEFGGEDNVFGRFSKLNFEAFQQELARTMMEPAVENGIATNIKILEKSNVPGKEDAIAMLKAHTGKAFSIMLEALDKDPESEAFQVLNHGDYWNNNMMFLKDKETNKIIGHIAVDLQVTRYCSPSVDIGYFLFTSVKPHVRELHFKDLFNVYLNALKATTENLGHPIDLTFEVWQLFADFRKKFTYGYWFGTIIATGAGFAVLKDIDPNEIDMSQWATIFNNLIEKWIDNNPEKSEESASTIMQNYKEFKRLSPA